jgi:hypothetical protein
MIGEFLLLERVRGRRNLKPTPLALTDQQFAQLMTVAEQLHRMDRDPFLRALADRFVGDWRR